MSRVCYPPLRDHKKKIVDEEPKPFEFCADCENVIYEFEDGIYKQFTVDCKHQPLPIYVFGEKKYYYDHRLYCFVLIRQ